jgi:hypothetical protein
MGFPVEKEPQMNETSAEKLVNVEKMDTSNKQESVVTPQNEDVDVSRLGKQFGDSGVVRSNVLNMGVIPTLQSKRGASINNTTALPKTHDVVIEDHSNNTRSKYNFKVHCLTCGWEGRYEFEERAKAVKQRHIDAHAA